LDHADWQWITTEYQTGVEEGTGSRSSWRVVATDLSCLRVIMMMMMNTFCTRHTPGCWQIWCWWKTCQIHGWHLEWALVTECIPEH